MPPILTDEQREHAAATAIISALPSDERRQAIIATLMRGKPPV